MTRLSTIALLVLASTQASAEWVLNNYASRLNFVSTKANTAAEVHTFGSLDGRVDATGNATVTIDLDTVDTSVDIRDERMREMLFETDRYPTATIAASIDAATIEAIKPGGRQNLVTEAQLLIHDTTVSLTLDLTITRLNKDTLIVSSRAPVIVNAGQSGLAAGVDKLREVAGLPSISPAVPVTFELAFESH